VDSTAPELVGVPADITVECDAIPAPATVTATDNCDTTLSVNYTETSNTVVDGVGTIVRQWSITDNGGNTTTETQTISVVDSTAPELVGVPADITVECDAIPALPNVTATDNCDTTLSVNYTETSNTVTDGVGTIVRQWSITDNGGNTTTETQTITVVDNTPPIITCPANITAQTSNDGAGNCTTIVDLGNPTVSDNCTVNSNLTIYNDAPATFPIGTTVVTWTVEDAAGNTSTCTQNVTVTDNENPTVTAAADVITTTSADGTGNCTVAVAITNATFGDNCTGSS
ncbi:HYR domain-containing protein, partial [Paucihalobacter ruber]